MSITEEILGEGEKIKLKVVWVRKMGMQDAPNHLTDPKAWSKRSIKTITVGPNNIQEISQSNFTFMWRTLEDQPILEESSEHLFVFTDGNRWMAVDTQGHDYPRYKSALTEKAEEKLSEMIQGGVRI